MTNVILHSVEGKMDLDNAPSKVLPSDYVDAWNITRDAQGSGQDKIVTPIKGNRLINYSLPSGVNKVIGSKEDLLRNRIYFFVWNSNGFHSILYYDGILDTVVHLLESKTDCLNWEDILLFNPSYKINHIDIIYRDEGDLLFFTDGQEDNVFCLDVAFISGFTTATIKREYIQAAKQTSQIPPFCFYEDDATITVNTLKKSLFKFKTRNVFNDLTKSITSSQSVLPLPINQDLANDPASKNAKISIAVLTGDKNVRKIEVLACNTVANTYSDYYLIETIDKDELGLGDNEVYVFAFYNNKAYNNIDVKESILLQSYVPQSAFTQASANGNTIEYANYVEGYDLNKVWNNGAGSANSYFANNGTITIRNTLEYSAVNCYQSGNSGYGTGNITIVFFGAIYKAGTTFLMSTSTGSAFTYTSVADLSASAFRAFVQAQAVIDGFTVVSSTGYGGQVLVISKANVYFDYFNLTTDISSISPDNYKGTLSVFDWWSRFQFGIVYYDEKDRTNGVVYPTTSSIQTSGYEIEYNGLFSPSYEKMQKVLCTLWNKPPSWASYYHIVRTKDLAKSFFVQWISDITLKEVGASAVDNSYVYIGINPLNAFIAENPSSNFLGYSFVPKDRIRFIKNSIYPTITYTYSTSFSGSIMAMNMTLAQSLEVPFKVGDSITISGTVSNNLTVIISAINYTGSQLQITMTTSPFTVETISTVNILDSTSSIIYSNKDFEILDLITNPTINGTAYVGQYVKIILPTSSPTFDFGSVNFYNYFFELYRPTVPAQGNLNVYYEFGQRFRIANAGTLLALHQGESQSQTVNGGGVVQTPALINMFQGDDYGRYRDIYTNPKVKWALPVKPFYYEFSGSETILLALNQTTTFKPVGYTIGDVIFVDFPNLGTTTNTIININDGKAHTFMFTLNANLLYKYLQLAAGAANFEVRVYALQDVPSTTNVSAVLFSRDFATNPINAPQQEFIQTTTSLTVPIGYNRIVLAVYFNGTTLQLDFNTFNLTVVETSSLVKQFCIDPNYSDYFQSAVNSNGRELIYDENAKQQRFGNSIRFSNEYQQNTNINKTNLFYPENLDDYDRSAGDIMKLYVDGRRLFVMQQFNVGVVPVLQQIVKTASGDSLLTQNDTLLNKIQYPYQGKLGIGNVPESFAYHEHAIYGIDNIKGVVWRLSQNGQEEISNIYECDAFFSANLDAYNATLNNGFGASGQPYLGNPTIYGGFDIYTNKYIIAMEEINRYDNTGTLIFHQAPYTLVFNESRDQSEGFECFTNYYPEGICSLGTLITTFKSGKIWLHDTGFTNFYGVQYNPSITILFNKDTHLTKTFNSIGYQADSHWVSDTNADISTSMINPQTNLPQISQLKQRDYEVQENIYKAAFLRDANSKKDARVALVNGDTLKGTWIKVKLINKQGDFAYLHSPYVTYSISNRIF